MTKQEYLIGDCLELLPTIEDKSVDMVIADPPYNINKADWDNTPDYLNWCMSWIKECQRVLKDNGSMYIFHSEMPTIARLINQIEDETDLVYKQFITWNKRFKGAKNKGFLDGFIEVEDLRNYQQMTEYVLFYTKQPLPYNWIQQNREHIKMSMNDIDIILGHVRNKNKERGTELCRRWEEGNSIPSETDYMKLCDVFGGLSESYIDYINKFNASRHTFNNQKTHHAVWEYEIEGKDGHETPKPVELIKNIILHSSNEGDLILDPFCGSGKTLRACRETNRNCLGIEKNKVNVDLIEKISLVNTPLLSSYVNTTK